ncbi:hypothetical protein [Mycoplasmopsis verecunda]|uniref:Lipoprotein n=1 Tax=Mycoplasmopsis verecunda TaxID=171291 RepID=A0A1T4LYP2_9BACT|nr:hypothetical protein [Mycoplasmopsis verecunda]WPB54468.1 hypothetical protein SAM46_03215 [Mycoplasmopsis verecunda]SJZ59853.1 hypothetical protein SAMN02745154_00576 [Mycoplasmopsis verecunda]
MKKWILLSSSLITTLPLIASQCSNSQHNEKSQPDEITKVGESNIQPYLRAYINKDNISKRVDDVEYYSKVLNEFINSMFNTSTKKNIDELLKEVSTNILENSDVELLLTIFKKPSSINKLINNSLKGHELSIGISNNSTITGVQKLLQQDKITTLELLTLKFMMKNINSLKTNYNSDQPILYTDIFNKFNVITFDDENVQKMWEIISLLLIASKNKKFFEIDNDQPQTIYINNTPPLFYPYQSILYEKPDDYDLAPNKYTKMTFKNKIILLPHLGMVHVNSYNNMYQILSALMSFYSINKYGDIKIIYSRDNDAFQLLDKSLNDFEHWFNKRGNVYYTFKVLSRDMKEKKPDLYNAIFIY